MASPEISDSLKSRFNIVSSKEEHGVLNAEIDQDRIREVLSYLLNELKFDHMEFMTAVDRPEAGEIEMIYRLYSYSSDDSVVIRVNLDRADPVIATVSDIYRTAEWHEREAAEMFGITFLNHPDPRTLLLPDGFEGYPLRKDFTHPNLIKIPEVK